MAVDPITPSARAGAFFDLDKTTIATATMFAFSSTLRDEGLLDYRLVLRALHGRIVFKYLGADHDRMEDMRNTALRMAKGWDQARIASLVTDAMEEVIEPIVFREALDEIAAHKAAGHPVFMVSASPEEIVRPLARHLGADGSVSTIAQIDDEGRYTGEVDFYSYGPYKVDAMEALALEYDLDLDRCYAYSDSVTDLPMLERVGHPVAVNPDKALLKEAIDRGWEIRVFENPQPLLEARTVRAPKPSTVASVAGAAAMGAAWWWRAQHSRAPKRPWSR